MTRTEKRLLVNLVGSQITCDHAQHWARLSAAGLIERRSIAGDTHQVIRTAEGDSLARQLKSDDPTLAAW